MRDLEIRRLDESDAPAISVLLTADPAEYRRHFEPFDTDPPAIARLLRSAERDRFWGIFADGSLGCLVMLRGLDAGFAAPAFGVYVAKSGSRTGLGSLALAFAEAWCRSNGCGEIMLTVHPENTTAMQMYERRGFMSDGERSARGHLVYRKRFAGDA